jgi:hypothetical protein
VRARKAVLEIFHAATPQLTPIKREVDRLLLLEQEIPGSNPGAPTELNLAPTVIYAVGVFLCAIECVSFCVSECTEQSPDQRSCTRSVIFFGCDITRSIVSSSAC